MHSVWNNLLDIHISQMRQTQELLQLELSIWVVVFIKNKLHWEPFTQNQILSIINLLKVEQHHNQLMSLVVLDEVELQTSLLMMWGLVMYLVTNLYLLPQVQKGCIQRERLKQQRLLWNWKEEHHVLKMKPKMFLPSRVMEVIKFFLESVMKIFNWNMTPEK